MDKIHLAKIKEDGGFDTPIAILGAEQIWRVRQKYLILLLGKIGQIIRENKLVREPKSQFIRYW